MKVKDRRETILHKAFEFGHLEQGFLKGREVEVKVTDGSKFYCYRSQGWSRGAITLPAETIMLGPMDFLTANEAAITRDLLDNSVANVPASEDKQDGLDTPIWAHNNNNFSHSVGSNLQQQSHQLPSSPGFSVAPTWDDILNHPIHGSPITLPEDENTGSTVRGSIFHTTSLPRSHAHRTPLPSTPRRYSPGISKHDNAPLPLTPESSPRQPPPISYHTPTPVSTPPLPIINPPTNSFFLGKRQHLSPVNIIKCEPPRKRIRLKGETTSLAALDTLPQYVPPPPLISPLKSKKR